MQFRGRLGFVKPLGSQGGQVRMVIDETGNVGIATTQPARQLEVFNSTTPQLRLTQGVANSLLPARFTDFQTTSGGNLRINPSDGIVGINPTVGINIPAGQEPQNSLEIVSGSTAPTPSGLRLRNLQNSLGTNPSTPIPNPDANGGVLSVNSNGDVIFVNDQTSTGGGVDYDWLVTGGTNPTNTTDINIQVYHLGQTSIGIDYYKSTPVGLISPYNIAFDVQQNVKTNLAIAGNFENLSCGPSARIGVRGAAGISSGTCNTFSVGVLGETYKGNQWAGFFVGNIGGTNTIAGNQITPSDTILKTVINSFNNGLEIIRDIIPISFRYNGKAGFDSSKTFIGVNAEEILSSAPYAIDTIYLPLESTDTIVSPILAVNTNAIMYTTINAVKELDSIVANMATLLVPNTPTPVSPVNNATGLPLKSIELKWLKSDHYASYFGEVSQDAAFNKVISKFSSSDTSAMVGVPDYNTTYYWRVAAVNMTGKSQYSAVFSFTTQPIPGTPILLSPVNNAVNVPLTSTYLWSNGIPVAYNVIEIAIDSNFKNLVAQYSVKDSSINITLKEYNTLHYWRVTAYLFDNKSAVSQTFRFTSEMLPGTATLIAPANGAAGVPLNATFLWSTGIKVHKHIIDVALDAGFKNMVAQYSIKDSTINITLKEYSMAHYWRVTTFVNANNSVGAVSQTWSFTTTGKAAAAMDTLTNVSYRSTSDSRYKTNIGTITDPLEKVLQLNGISYDWDVAGFPDIHFDSNRQLGFIAQEVEPIIPEVVRKDSNGYYSLDYDRFIPVLVEAIKQQQETIDSLKQQNFNLESMQQQLSAIQNCVDNLPNGFGCNGSSRMANPDNNSGNERETQKIALESAGTAILYQNEPNPFGNSTIIRYYVPESVTEAMLVFYDEFGKEISREKLSAKGYASVEINAQKLSSGIYTYSIVTDGKTGDTKKMMKSR